MTVPADAVRPDAVNVIVADGRAAGVTMPQHVKTIPELFGRATKGVTFHQPHRRYRPDWAKVIAV